MNEQAKEILAQMLQRVLDGVDTVSEFAAQEVPIVVEQLLMWHMVESFIRGSLGLAMAVGYYFLITRVAKPCAEKELQMSADRFGTFPVTFFASIVYPPITFILLSDWLTVVKIWIAPKLYLLEYGASLVK